MLADTANVNLYLFEILKKKEGNSTRLQYWCINIGIQQNQVLLTINTFFPSTQRKNIRNNITSWFMDLHIGNRWIMERRDIFNIIRDEVCFCLSWWRLKVTLYIFLSFSYYFLCTFYSLYFFFWICIWFYYYSFLFIIYLQNLCATHLAWVPNLCATHLAYKIFYIYIKKRGNEKESAWVPLEKASNCVYEMAYLHTDW